MDFEAGREVLGLHGFIELERTRPEVNEAQHIYNKLLYDAVNEVKARATTWNPLVDSILFHHQQTRHGFHPIGNSVLNWVDWLWEMTT